MGCIRAPNALAAVALTLVAGCGGWSNWAGNVRCKPTRIVAPRTETALRSEVRLAKRLRVAGAGHSFSALVCTDATLIDIRRLKRVLSMDTAARRIRVEAGITLREVDEVVRAHGLALATAPTIDKITAGGAIATASHGTGLAHGAFSEEVVALDVIDADGNLVTIDDPDGLRAARVGLGAVGVIYAITFRLVPAFNFAIRQRVLDEKAGFDAVDGLLAENEHVDLFWFPTERKVYVRTYNRTDAPRAIDHPARDWIGEHIVRTWIARFGLAVASKISRAARLLNRAVPPMMPEREEVGRSDEILHRFPGHQKVVSMEYLIPIARWREAVRAIDDALAATQFYPNIPPYMRFIGGAGDGDLSPMRGRPSCAIEVLSHPSFSGWEPFFRDVERRFRALGGRPHWGKLFYESPRDLYDPADWAHVERLRTRLDPDGKFLNSLTENLFRPKR